MTSVLPPTKFNVDKPQAFDLTRVLFGLLMGSGFSTTPFNYNFDKLIYDGNDNMISDHNKKITGITYNILNLPSLNTVAGQTTYNLCHFHQVHSESQSENNTSNVKVTKTVDEIIRNERKGTIN